MMKKFSGLFLGVFFWLTSSSQIMALPKEVTIDTCNGGAGIDTGLGCMPTDMSSFISWLLTWLFGVAGGIAFVLMVTGFIMLGTSQGDEKKMAGAKETITSAITGLLVSIFAIFILRLITIDILKIPGIS